MTSATIRHSILTLGLLTLAGHAYAQGAEPALSFYPAKAWTSGTGAMCSIQSEFNNGFVIGFSGKNQAISALNIDFKQDALEAGKTYDVAFRIPGGPTQRFSANAPTASMLNVSVRDSGGMTAALHNASAFDVSVEDNSFRFFLTGFAGGAKGFEQCMGVATAQAAPAPIAIKQVEAVPDKAPPPPLFDPAAKPVAENMPERIVDPAPEISISATLPADKPEMPYAPPAPRSRMSEKLAKEIDQNPEIVNIENTPVELRQENGAKAQGSSLKADETFAFAAEPLPVNAVKSEPIPAATAEKPAGGTVTQKQTPEIVVHTQRSEAKVDLTPFGKTEPAGNGEMPDHFLPTAAEAKALEANRALAAAKPDPAVTATKLAELERTVESLKQENEDLKSSAGSPAAGGDAGMSISSSNWNLERATMRYDEAQREIKRMGQQLQQERAQCSVEKQDLEAQLFDPQVTARQQLAKLADLEQKLAEVQQKAESQRIYYEERIRIMEGEKGATQ